MIPYVELSIKFHKQITSSLLNGSPDIKETYDYFVYGKVDKDNELVNINYFKKLQEIAANNVHS